MTWCQACTVYSDVHEHGMLVGRVFHWRNRRVTRPGVYKLLRKIAWGQSAILSRFPLWRQIYLLNQDVLAMARQIGIRLPRSVSDLDRAKLRYALSEFRSADVRRMMPSEQKDYKAAVRWAARS